MPKVLQVKSGTDCAVTDDVDFLFDNYDRTTCASRQFCWRIELKVLFMSVRTSPTSGTLVQNVGAVSIRG